MSSARVYGIFTGRSAPLGPGGVPSAFIKKRAQSAVAVNTVGFEDDEQADLRVHGGPDMAIYAYNRAHYEAWNAEYPEHVELWGDGALGENLSMGGWDETDVCIGDMVHLGRAILQVTRPRKPCFKLALRFNDLRLPRRLTETGRCGWYYRVLKAGTISEGDEAVLVSRLHPDWSIRRVNDISIQAEPDLTELRELAGLPELAGNWRAQVETSAIARTAAAKKNSFRKFRVVKVMDESASVRSFEIIPADGEGIAPALAGQHVVVKGGFGGGKASRPYSISAIANTHLQISVKREKGGFSEWLHDAVSAGDHLEILGPRGSFRLDTASGRPVVLISAGIGITPMMAMIQSATTNNGSKVVPSSISFIHCARDSSQQTFKSQLADIAMRHPAVTFHTRFSRPLCSDQIGRSHDSIGRIDKALVTQMVAPIGACDVYVCGPDAFMTAVKTWIEELGVPGIRVMTEAFGTADGKAAGVRSQTRPKLAHVTFARTGRVFEMNDAGSLLDLAEAEGVTVESDCRSGNCGACVATIVSGEVGYDIEPTISVEENQVLLCCGFPVADANFRSALSGVVSGIFAATGRTCIAGSRLLVQNSTKNRFVAALTEIARSAKIGDPMLPDINIGPVTTPAQYKKVLDYIEIARSEGARCILGGKPATGEGVKGGQFVEPTIFTDVDNSMRVAQEEVFGPVLSVIGFDHRGRRRPNLERHPLRTCCGHLDF